MEQSNLDAMFEDMLGELDIISQQLEEKTDKTEVSNAYSVQNRASTSSQSSAADREADFDLKAMLNDLTDWEETLSPSTRVHVAPEVGSDDCHDSGVGFSSNSLSQDSNKLTYGLDVSPQFNTLKRSMTDGPSVTFGDDDDLSLASLEKDIESENRKKDKSRQLSAEELAALTPVMQELDDLVSDLSNMSFKHDCGFQRKASLESENEQLRTNVAPVTEHPPHSTTSQKNNLHKSSKTDTEALKKTDRQPYSWSVNERSTQKSEVIKDLDEDKNFPMEGKDLTNGAETLLLGNAASSPKKNTVINAAKLFENEPKFSQKSKTIELTGLKEIVSPRASRTSRTQPLSNKTKPPVPPPLAMKPKLHEKPQPATTFHRQRSTSVPCMPQPTMLVKRQPSVKVPANLTNILERQLQQHGVLGEQQRTTSDSIQGVDKFTPTFPQDSVEHHEPENSLLPNSTESKLFSPEAHLSGSAHSASLVSVESNLSTTSSVTSFKSNNSADSSDSRHSADYANDKFVPEDIKVFLSVNPRPTEREHSIPELREERMRAEKMRIALEKLKEARIQKLVVKVFNKDDSSKTLMVDERMTTRTVIKQLLEKNHYEPSVNWALVEELPSLYMERIFEEHESVTEMLSYWTRDTSNQVRFLERKDKYALFRNPQHYLLSVSDTEGQMAERQKQTLIEEFFSGRSGSGVPEVQGILYIKGESKSWGRKYCVLRNSGLYCSKSGEPKKGKKVSDLQCLVMFEQVCVYLGRGWKKKHKSPTDYGFALKHPAIQTKSKHIRYFCCDDVRSLMRWIVGIRCAKYGKLLKDNFDRTNVEMKVLGDGPALAYSTTQIDEGSNASNESKESDKPAVPRASITNVFGGAWQRANQQENSESGAESFQRGKSVWNPGQSKMNSNWWDLGASPELEELAGNSQIPVARFSETDSQSSDFHLPSQMGYNGDSAPSSVSRMTSMPPPPPQQMPDIPSQSSTHVRTNAARKPTPPPPPAKNVASRQAMMPEQSSPMRPAIPRSKMPPPLGPKPMVKNLTDPPPPPSMDDFPPPPPLDDIPPPPPMDDLPPPPDDDIPLPPPMEVSPNPGLPKGPRSMEGQAPIRLPFLPMFKNGNPIANLRHSAPFPPGSQQSENFNSSNNKPLLPSGAHTRAPRKSFGIQNSHFHQHHISGLQPPLEEYYTSEGNTVGNALYCKDNLPPPPEFVFDLKDTFEHATGRDLNPLADLPPPPPELLLHEVRSRIFLNASRTVKSAPPPPRRNPNTKLSFKKK